MALTPEEKREVARIKGSPGFEAKPGMTDEEILAAARFLENGKGLKVYASEEEYRAAMKKEKGIDTIDEV